MSLGDDPPLREPTIPPAVRHPRKPRLKLPQGSCDCHAHVFGPQSRFGYLPNAAYIPPDQTVDDYVRALKTLGCERAVLVQPSVYGTNHAAMLTAMRSGKFNFRGVAVVSPNITDEELHALHDAGFRGIRINLASKTPGLPFEAATSLAVRIKPLGWHLQFFLSVPTFDDVERRLASLPVNVVIDHFGLIDCSAGLGAPGFQRLLRLLQHENVWMKMSGVYHASKKAPLAPDLAPFARKIVETAPARLVWATDWPHPTAAWIPDDGDLVDMLADWIPDESLRQSILVENPAKLYQFS
jgi:predicted TIM-barrel fold metal-dependent hydrolase